MPSPDLNGKTGYLSCETARQGRILDLACCIARAEMASSGTISPGNDVYWHTREACMVMAKESGIKTAELVRALSGSSWMTTKVLLARSSNLWPLVAHPDVLAREVMED